MVQPAAPVAANAAPFAEVAVAESDDEPLFAPNHYDERRARGGFKGMFNRPRHPPAAARPSLPGRSSGGAQAALDTRAEVDAEENETLAIPTFLRRLAN
jgi:hypothetical protein